MADILPGPPPADGEERNRGNSRSAHTSAYAELQVTTNYSFLRGGSHAAELVGRAADLGHAAIAITDRNSLAGVVRAHVAAKEAGLKLVVGARVDTRDKLSLLLYPTDRAAYGRLSRMLSEGNLRTEKGDCRLFRADLETYGEGMVTAVLPPRDPRSAAFQERLAALARIYPGRCYLAAGMLFRGNDAQRLAQLETLARRYGTPLLATNDVHYHVPERRALQDVLTAIRLGCTVDQAGFRLFANAERHLKPPEEMARLFHRHPDAVARTLELTDRCRFSLEELKYEYLITPDYDGRTPQQELERLTWLGAAERFPDGVPEKIRKSIEHELALVAGLKYASYFLTVQEIVAFARSQNILCQGRGSAANSVICYCLGITSVNPTEVDLLFERFISASRNEPPDIDVDFEHERREEVIQYVYSHYRPERAALAATVISYRSRSAMREVGKALGLSPDTVGILADTVWGTGTGGVEAEHVRSVGLDPTDRRLAMALEISAALCGFPRHLSQHVGGFVLTRGRLDELVPIQNAAMEDRRIVEWDKDDLDALGILKIDVLALGMLTCLRKGFDLLERHYDRKVTLATMPREDPVVYEMLCRADSLGVFQVESRAQMSMLPRLRPKRFYDLVIEVAIVRPGPIQGDMVHPYLRRRMGLEDVTYPSPKLKAVLEKTLGVPLFQEQAMKIAIEAADFTPDDADRLRRAMATFRHSGTIHKFRDKMINGMLRNGYEREFAERCFSQIEGFGEYGFPESHAASFALLVYASSWIKHHYPAVFAAALLNSQPMGFYAPAQIVRDAREHGVEVLPPDINRSDWDCTLEPSNTSPPARRGEKCMALRLGLRQITGINKAEVERLLERRGTGYRDVADLWRRGGVSRRQIEVLARADAFGSLGLSRRDALWAARGLREEQLPLFSAIEAESAGAVPEQDERPAKDRHGEVDIEREPSVRLPTMAIGEQVVDDYTSLQLTLRSHPLALLRSRLDPKIVRSSELATLPLDRRTVICGLVLVRQRPGSASGTVFITIEDETGIANAIVWPHVFERYRRVIMGSRMLRIEGRLQREGNPEDGQVIHIVAEHLVDCSALLDSVITVEEEPSHHDTALPQTGTPIVPDGDKRRRGGSYYKPPVGVAQAHLPQRARDFMLPRGPADQAKSGSPDPREKPKPQRSQGATPTPRRARPIKIQSHDFH
jgi:error-prone DNA polymerase